MCINSIKINVIHYLSNLLCLYTEKKIRLKNTNYISYSDGFGSNKRYIKFSGMYLIKITHN